MKLKEMYESNLQYLEEHGEIEDEIKYLNADHKKKIDELRAKQKKLEKENCRVIKGEYWDETLTKFYLELKKEDFMVSPNIVLNSESVGGKTSTYQFFKQKIEEYIKSEYVLIRVITPLKEMHYDRDGELETYTTVHDLLIPAKLLSKISANIEKMTEEQYKKILKLNGIYKIEDDCNYGVHTPKLTALDEGEIYYSLQISNFRNKDKNLLAYPLNPNYDKALDDILFDTLEYSLKINKLKKMMREKEDVDKQLKKQKDLEAKRIRLQKQIECDLVK